MNNGHESSTKSNKHNSFLVYHNNENEINIDNITTKLNMLDDLNDKHEYKQENNLINKETINKLNLIKLIVIKTNANRAQENDTEIKHMRTVNELSNSPEKLSKNGGYFQESPSIKKQNTNPIDKNSFKNKNFTTNFILKRVGESEVKPSAAKRTTQTFKIDGNNELNILYRYNKITVT
jgi:hypothetical protein